MEAAVGNTSCGFQPTKEQESRLGYGSLSAVIEALAHAVSGRRFIAGDRFSAADVYVGSQIGWGMRFGSVEKRPQFEAYWAGLKDRPAHLRIQAAVEEAMAKYAAKGS